MNELSIGDDPHLAVQGRHRMASELFHIGNSVMLPPGVTRVSESPTPLATQRFPSDPSAMPVG